MERSSEFRAKSRGGVVSLSGEGNLPSSTTMKRGIAVISVQADSIHRAQASALVKAICSAAATSCQVLVDLKAVRSMDTSAMGALVTGQRSAMSVGSDVSVSNPTEELRAIMESLQLHQVVRMFDDDSTALDYLGLVEAE